MASARLFHFSLNLEHDISGKFAIHLDFTNFGNPTVLIEAIVAKLRVNAKLEAVDKIMALRQGASTGGELLTSVTHELLMLAEQDSFINALLKDEIQSLNIICDFNGVKAF